MKNAHSKNGRMQALGVLDSLLAKADNQEKLRIDMQKEFDAAPMEFFKKVVMPLLPKVQDTLAETLLAQLTPAEACTEFDNSTLGVDKEQENVERGSSETAPTDKAE